MASFATTIEEFSDKENYRTYAISGHSVADPKLLIQKRKVATTPTGRSENTLMVVYGTEDDDGTPLASKVVFEVNHRQPANGASSVTTAALAVFRDFVASDEFTAMVTGQLYVQ